MAVRPAGQKVASSVEQHPRYESDFYSWSLDQARLVREGRWDRVDRENVAEEIESLGREQFNKLESTFRLILLHMLKCEHQPSHRSRSWILSIREHRIELEDIIKDNSGLKPWIGEAIARAYRRARVQAARETGLEETIFPETCGYSLDDITSRPFSLDAR
jgi:Domain of unknown function DUF29